MTRSRWRVIQLFLNPKIQQTRPIHLMHSYRVSAYRNASARTRSQLSSFISFLFIYFRIFGADSRKHLQRRGSGKDSDADVTFRLGVDSLGFFYDSFYCWEQFLVEDSTLHCLVKHCDSTRVWKWKFSDSISECGCQIFKLYTRMLCHFQSNNFLRFFEILSEFLEEDSWKFTGWRRYSSQHVPRFWWLKKKIMLGRWNLKRWHSLHYSWQSFCILGQFFMNIYDSLPLFANIYFYLLRAIELNNMPLTWIQNGQ